MRIQGYYRNYYQGHMLADRGFTIQEAAGLYCAKAKQSPFTRGKRQLSNIEVDAARRLSQVRIHVERII